MAWLVRSIARVGKRRGVYVLNRFFDRLFYSYFKDYQVVLFLDGLLHARVRASACC